MKRRKTLLSLLLVLSLSTAISLPATVYASTPTIKNVIYMIPDGGGYGSYDFSNMVKQAGGFDAVKFPNKTPTDTTPMALGKQLAGSAKTSPFGGGITDSAAAGTALATGHKTINGRIGVNSNGKPIANLVEAAQKVGKATGIVATYEWMHATPAAFTAHAMDRNDYKNMYEQIENQGLDVVLGAGYDAVSSFATIQNAIDNGYTIIDTKSKLDEVKGGDKLWGNMCSPNTSMPYDINLSSTQATIAEMTEAAITALSDDEDGFFLMVEGSKVDTGGHANDATIVASEFLAFDAAFKVALDFAKSRTDTVVIAAPDHDTGGLNISNDMSSQVALVQQGTNPSTISWTSYNHTEQDVGVWMYVPEGVSVINGLNSTLGDTPSTRTDYVIDNTAIAPYVASLFGVNLATLTDELFTDVTKIGSYANGKFTFNNGNKYVYANQDVYYKDNNEVSMGGKIALYVDGKFYVPSDIVDEEDWEHINDNAYNFSGEGTAASPYIIATADDFLGFTKTMQAGEKHAGVYFKQTADIDLSEISTYTGIGNGSYFNGIYDGNGHTINVNLASNSDKCIFPYVEGTIMNLGTTGSIYSSASGQLGGIIRSLRATGKLINSYSTVNISTAEDVNHTIGGLASSNYGAFVNCYYAGIITPTSSGTNSPLAWTNANGNYTNCYFTEDCGATQAQTGTNSITRATANNSLASTLNYNRSSAATVAGVDVSKIKFWQQNNALPTFSQGSSSVTSVIITPSKAVVAKGSSLQLSAAVEGEFGPSQQVIWSIEPQSNFAGTSINSSGMLSIDRNETRESFTILAKSAQNGSVSGACTITVSDAEHTLEGSGTSASPYIIADAEDFLLFTSYMLAGDKMEGSYFKQTADIDLSKISTYTGVGSGTYFNGIYDGNGHTINVNLNTDSDKCIFPYVEGTIMNLGTTGSIYSSASGQLGGIIRSLRATGKLVNCYSTANISTAKNVNHTIGGLASSNYGILENCYYAGVITPSTSGTNSPFAWTNANGCYNNCYFTDDCGATQSQSGTNSISRENAINTLAHTLNTNRSNAANTIGVDSTKISYWTQNNGSLPILTGKGIIASVSDISHNEQKLTGKIIFDICTTACNGYVALYDDYGNMKTVQKLSIVSGTTLEDFELDAVLTENNSYIIKLFMWDNDMLSLSVPFVQTYLTIQ